MIQKNKKHVDAKKTSGPKISAKLPKPPETEDLLNKIDHVLKETKRQPRRIERCGC